MQYNFILEGPTRCGKSSLIKQFTSSIDMTNKIVHHFEWPKGTTNDEKQYFQLGHFQLAMEWITKLNEKGIYVILDRCWLDERVFGPIYRNYDPDPLLSELEEKYINFAPTKIIQLTCEYQDVILRRILTADTRPFMNEEQWHKINEDFTSAVKKTVNNCKNNNIQHLNFDTSKMSIKQIITELN